MMMNIRSVILCVAVAIFSEVAHAQEPVCHRDGSGLESAFTRAPLCAEARLLHEPVNFSFDIFSTPQRASFELKVPDREKYNATINLNTSRKHSNTLMEFARHLGAASGNLKLPLQAHIKVTRIDNKEKVLELTTDTEELYASSPTQLSFRIQSFTLEKGEYDVEVETLAALAPIHDVSSSFMFFVRKL
jgi:hypothetical protein